MKYRRLGRTGVDISEISLGAEGLAEQHEDVETITATVRRAVDKGVNFIDCPIWWPEYRDAQGTALAGIRDRILLSAHLGVTYRKPETPPTDLFSYMWSSAYPTRDPALCEASFHDLLTRLRTDYIDVLFLSVVDEEADYQTVFDRDGFLGLALRLKREGRARFLALSTHRSTIGMKAIQTGLIDAIMFPVNAAHDLFTGDKGLNYMWQKDPYQRMAEEGTGPSTDRLDFCLACQQKDIGLIAMKPFAGGLLLTEGVVDSFLTGKGFEHPGGVALTPVQCLAYVLSRPGVSAALPGCADPKELEAALVYCDSAEHHPETRTRAAYGALARKASDCTECGVCTDRCPFGVDVPGRMQRAVEVFGA